MKFWVNFEWSTETSQIFKSENNQNFEGNFEERGKNNENFWKMLIKYWENFW